MFPSPPRNSSQEQATLEEKVIRLYRQLEDAPPELLQHRLQLQREAQVAYLHRGLGKLPNGYIGLDASRPWLVFWIVHSLALLNAPLPQEVDSSAIVAFLARCQDAAGGFGGGPGQLPHLAPTYAAIATLVTLGSHEALALIHRSGIWSFLRRMVRPPCQGGGFHLCEGGEVDVRGCYTAMAIAHMVGLDTVALAAEADLASFVRACQTYEGGIGGEPGNEAHGGYAFCGLAAAVIAGQESCLDLGRLADWATSCQGKIEGGFMGRTNKLVDGCYSYWVGALFPLLRSLQSNQQENSSQEHPHQQQRQRQQQQHSTSIESEGDRIVWSESMPPGGLPSSDDDCLLPHDGDVPRGATALVHRWGLSPTIADPGQEGSINGNACDTTVNKDNESCAAPRGGFLSIPECNSEPCQRSSVTMSTRFANGANSKGFDTEALQLWLLHCCQGNRGGLRDKPGKAVDYYHTCYCLSGLTAAQHHSGIVVGPLQNVLCEPDLLCNVVKPQVAKARTFFSQATNNEGREACTPE